MTLELTLILTNGCELNKKGCTLLSAPILLEKKLINVLAQLFLRDMFDAVRPGYHMNKTHWNTVILDGSIPPGEIERMIDRSYGLVVRKLKKAERIALETCHGTEALYR